MEEKANSLSKPFSLLLLRFVVVTSWGLILHLIGRETINIPEIILSVYCFRVLTVSRHWL